MNEFAKGEQYLMVLYDSSDKWPAVVEDMDARYDKGWEVVSVWNATAGNVAFTTCMPGDIRVLYRRI